MSVTSALLVDLTGLPQPNTDQICLSQRRYDYTVVVAYMLLLCVCESQQHCNMRSSCWSNEAASESKLADQREGGQRALPRAIWPQQLQQIDLARRWMSSQHGPEHDVTWHDDVTPSCQSNNDEFVITPPS